MPTEEWSRYQRKVNGRGMTFLQSMMTIELFRDDHGKKAFYYAQSNGVHRLLAKAGGIDNKDRDVRLTSIQ